jgi:hypothetical protein
MNESSKDEVCSPAYDLNVETREIITRAITLHSSVFEPIVPNTAPIDRDYRTVRIGLGRKLEDQVTRFLLETMKRDDLIMAVGSDFNQRLIERYIESHVQGNTYYAHIAEPERRMQLRKDMDHPDQKVLLSTLQFTTPRHVKINAYNKGMKVGHYKTFWVLGAADVFERITEKAFYQWAHPLMDSESYDPTKEVNNGYNKPFNGYKFVFLD